MKGVYDEDAKIAPLSRQSYSVKDDFFNCDKKTIYELPDIGEVKFLHKIWVVSIF